MTIQTGVSPTLLNPQTFHTFSYTLAAPGLTPLEQRVALIGAKMASGTAVAGTVYEIGNSTDSDALFGLGSELALMCRKAFDTIKLNGGVGPKIFAVALAESGGVANVKTITGTGAATADGVINFSIAGRRLQAGVRSGDSANTIATAIANAAKAISDNLPVAISVAANVVTLTHNTKGVNGGDVAVTIDSAVAGNTQALVNTVAGTLVTDHQPALDALAPLPFDGLALANHAAADITEVLTDSAARWGYAEKRWRFYFFGEMGSIGTATTLASAANDRSVLIANMPGCLNTAGEMAAALCVKAFSTTRPNANFDGQRLPLSPPPAASVMTPTQIESALAAGLVPLGAVLDSKRNVVDGFATIKRMVTTKTTSGGQPYGLLRDLAVPRTGVYMARQVDAAYEQRFGADAAGPDGTLISDDTVGQVKDMYEGLARAAQDINILKNVDADIAALRVEIDAQVATRLDVDFTYTPVNGLHQLANAHRVQVG